jgi:hypothetical protein
MTRLAPGAEEWLSTEVTPRFVWRSCGVALLINALIWSAVGLKRPIPLHGLLHHYDSGWYGRIAAEGYDGPAWAFYPLWPLLVRAVSWAVPLPLPIVQALLAYALFLATVALVFTRASSADLLAPRTRLGWLFFLAAPAGYVFHSGHTESLYLLLSMGAFFSAARGAWVWAAVLAGLSGLTRAPGAFVCVAVGLWTFRLAPHSERLRRFLVTGVLGAALFALYPAYQYLVTGDAFIGTKSQSHWTSAHGLGDVLKALVLGNAVNPWEYATRVRHVWFLGFLLTCALLLRKERHRPLALCCLASLLLMLLQGTVSNFFRYSVVLAPLFFFIGDSLAGRGVKLVAALLVPTLYFHVELTWNYAIGRWPY